MNFVSQLGRAFKANELSELERSICILWAHERDGSTGGLSVNEISAHLIGHGFAQPNISRLKARLKQSKFTKRTGAENCFGINASQIRELDEKFSAMFHGRVDPRTEGIVSSQDFKNSTKYLLSMVWQINKSYEENIFDGCAVLMRRLVESLLIEIYFQNGRLGEISDAEGNFKTLDFIVKHVSGHEYIKIGRGSKKFLPILKIMGDTAAHHRSYIASKDDISKNIHAFRVLLSDLLSHCPKFSERELKS